MASALSSKRSSTPGFEQRMIFERGVGGEELLGGGLRLVQKG